MIHIVTCVGPYTPTEAACLGFKASPSSITGAYTGNVFKTSS